MGKERMGKNPLHCTKSPSTNINLSREIFLKTCIKGIMSKIHQVRFVNISSPKSPIPKVMIERDFVGVLFWVVLGKILLITPLKSGHKKTQSGL